VRLMRQPIMWQCKVGTDELKASKTKIRWSRELETIAKRLDMFFDPNVYLIAPLLSLGDPWMYLNEHENYPPVQSKILRFDSIPCNTTSCDRPSTKTDQTLLWSRSNNKSDHLEIIRDICAQVSFMRCSSRKLRV
jgi:hypothetical protein